MVPGIWWLLRSGRYTAIEWGHKKHVSSSSSQYHGRVFLPRLTTGHNTTLQPMLTNCHHHDGIEHHVWSVYILELQTIHCPLVFTVTEKAPTSVSVDECVPIQNRSGVD